MWSTRRRKSHIDDGDLYFILPALWLDGRYSAYCALSSFSIRFPFRVSPHVPSISPSQLAPAQPGNGPRGSSNGSAVRQFRLIPSARQSPRPATHHAAPLLRCLASQPSCPRRLSPSVAFHQYGKTRHGGGNDDGTTVETTAVRRRVRRSVYCGVSVGRSGLWRPLPGPLPAE